MRERRSLPLRIEFNLTDYCNLNCKGCSHFSPVAPEEYQDLKDFENTVRKISAIRNADQIKEIYLIGGETLLFPQINEAVKIARKYFPEAGLSIFTNGLLLPKMSDEFWKVVKENDCTIALTRYPIKFDYDRVEEICRERGVRLNVFGDRGKENSFFRMPLDKEKRQNGRLSHLRCFSFGCITVDHGRIFPCAQAACVGHLNARFGTDFKWEKGDYIEIDELKDADQLYELRNRPVPFCRYCLPIEPVKYESSGRKPEEWIG